MFLSLALALLTAAAPADTVPGGVRGVVRSDPGGLPVASAVVELRDTETGGARTFTDSLGAYHLVGVSPGRHTLRFRHLEHAPTELQLLVPAGATVVLDVSLRYRPLALDTVRARGPGDVMGDTVAVRRSEVGWVDSRALEDGSGMEGALPVAGTGGDPAPAPTPEDVFYVRGSAADLKLVLLDGAPVYAPFHMSGLMEAFDPGVLRSARLYVGGAPARYDGGLSYVMELATRGGNAERHSLEVGADVMTARGVAEGPIAGGATYLLAGRLVHGASMRGLEAGDAFPYRYQDGLARIDVPLHGGVLRATAFGNREGVRLKQDGVFAGWKNRAGSLRYRGGVLGPEGEVTAALGDFFAALAYHGAHVLALRGETRRARFAVDLVGKPLGALTLRYGASADYSRVRYQVDEIALGWQPVVDTHSSGGTVAAYGDASWQPHPRLRLRGGARADAFSHAPLLAVSPRAAATWLVGDRAALTLAAGRYHQFVRAHGGNPEPSPPVSFADSVERTVATELVVAAANHLSLGLDQELVDGVRLGIEGFYKRYEGVPLSHGVGSYTSGMDVWVRRGVGPVTGWLGYNLAWQWSRPDTALASDRFVGRQVLSAGAAGKLGRKARFGVRFQYGSDLSASEHFALDGTQVGETDLSTPTTFSGTTTGDAPLTVNRAKPYLRLDVEVERSWNLPIRGHRTVFTPYFRLINALDQRDALFYEPEPSGGGIRAVGGFPVLPVIGLNWKL
ncbi:MAG TPA: carboxypeptidase-like regulatory domain-containing protein [Longimicrobium sp.]|nr:carboxypeptidase-like regulatory domain-containing protein [Longimicrobium sp.]